MGRKLDLLGQRFGRLVVIRSAGTNRFRQRLWECQCDCGKKTTVVAGHLRSGNTRGCGCQNKGTTTHGHATRNPSKLYKAWNSMIQRCYHPSQNCFARYGGRGVRVCDRWNPKAGGCFENFLADMGEPPSARHTLDKDKLGDGMLYSPETCCWLTPEEQARHTRRTAWVTYNGQEMLLGEAAKLAGLPLSTVTNRRRRGWPEERWFEPAKKITPNPNRRIRRTYSSRTR